MTEEIKKVPDGVLAENALRDEEAMQQVADAPSTIKDQPSFAVMPPDPNYHEPTALAHYRDIHDAISRDAHSATTGEQVLKASMARKVLIDFLLKRVEVLESALRPFCVVGTMLANAQMCLAAAGEGDSPAGGTWMSNPPEGIQLQPNAGYFYHAVDTFGRAATEAHMAAVFEAVQKSAKLAAEKAEHIEAGGRADH